MRKSAHELQPSSSKVCILFSCCKLGAFVHTHFLRGACWAPAQFDGEVRRQPGMANDEAPSTWVSVFQVSRLSYGESSLIFIICTTLAAGRVLFALTEKSSRVLITCIFLPFLPTNKTNHAQILLLCHQGEGGASVFGSPFVLACVCRWKP